jgi:hypothetical protein
MGGIVRRTRQYARQDEIGSILGGRGHAFYNSHGYCHDWAKLAFPGAFGFSVGGNVLIWTLGVAVAYIAHSHIPGFGAKQKLVKTLQDRVSAMHAKDLQHRSDRHISKAQHDLTNLTQLEARQLRGRPDYVVARARFEELRKIDNQVLAVLGEYRSLLADEVRRRGGSSFEIEEIDSLSRDMRKQIDLSAFEHLKLRLPYA